ncbi:YihY/virulence factor BrkB family protein [Agromyces sp. MMS24-K17]|uniref:YihY/virulence factor BrkB family protein n=1 Tax=Agromyces sp. MMS24-K17 TaxID=3372850 RepID=UPI003753F3CD
MPDDSPARFSRDEWRVALTRTWHEFRISQATDIAASLAYYAVLSVFPAVLAGLAVLGAFGTAEDVTREVLSVLADVGGERAADALQEPVGQLLDASHQWFAIVVGLAGTLWSVSGYLGAFGRGMNRILHVEEGRPFWSSRPRMILVAAVLTALGAVVAVLLLVSGPVADAVWRTLGLGEEATPWWDVVKVPVVVVIVAVIIAILYWATPNVKRRHVRWISIGASGAVLVWIVTTALFGWYVVGFRTFERNYGVLGGAVAFLLWVWLSNLAVVFGAVLDSEIERVRQVRAGVHAVVFLDLPLRDDRMVRRNRRQREADVRATSELARAAVADPDAPARSAPVHRAEDAPATTGSATAGRH